MQAHFLGYTQDGISWQTPKCPVCGYFFPKFDELTKHFNDLHSLGIEWFVISAVDPRLPGVQFHLLVDDPMMAKFIGGKTIRPEKKPKPKAKR